MPWAPVRPWSLVVTLVASAAFARVAQGETIQVLRNHQDTPLLSEAIVDYSAPANGTASLRDGTLFYTPRADYVGEDTIDVTVADQQVRTITIDVRAHPNFVFILSDDQSWTGLSARMDLNDPASASDLHRTPSIDSIAAAGMRFSRGYSPAPNCAPTRYADLTGKTPARLRFTHLPDRGQRIPPAGEYPLFPAVLTIGEIGESDTTIPEILKALPGADYTTAHWGKWQLGGGGPEQHGFDVSGEDGGDTNDGPLSEDPKQVYAITTGANLFMSDAVAARRPFYCQIWHYAPHSPTEYSTQTIAETETWEPGTNHTDTAYAAMVLDLDHSIGQVLDHLDALGLRQSTYLIFQSDNGAHLAHSNAYPLRGGKPEIWDGGTRVPTIIRGPGIPAGSQADQPMMGVDILPTIWELAGGDAADLPADLDGGSLSPWLGGDPEVEIQRPGALVVHSPHYIVNRGGTKNQRPSSALHEGPWKLVAWYESGDVHLFNLAEDKTETNDLGAEYPVEKLRLWERLRDYLAEVDAQLPTLDAAYPDSPGDGDDVDADGLPDDWEMHQLLTHALGPDDDPDGDRRSNAVEFDAGTDPLFGFASAVRQVGELVRLAECGPDDVSPKLKLEKQVERIQIFLVRAERATKDRRTRRLVRRAGKRLGALGKRSTRLGRRGTMPTICADALRLHMDGLRVSVAGLAPSKRTTP